MSLLNLNESIPEGIDEGPSVPGEHLVENFVITYSASKILKDLGYETLSRELRNYMKVLGGDLVIKLATGHYKSNLASILSAGISGKKDFISDEGLYDLLLSALNLKELMNIAEAKAVKSLSKSLFEKFMKLMCNDGIGKLERVVNPEDPKDVLQALATGIAVFVGGFNGV